MRYILTDEEIDGRIAALMSRAEEPNTHQLMLGLQGTSFARVAMARRRFLDLHADEVAVTVRLPKDLHEAAQAWATDAGACVADVLREIAAHYLRPGAGRSKVAKKRK